MKLSKRNKGAKFWNRVTVGEFHKYAISIMSGSCVKIQAAQHGYEVEIIGCNGDFKIVGRTDIGQ